MSVEISKFLQLKWLFITNYKAASSDGDHYTMPPAPPRYLLLVPPPKKKHLCSLLKKRFWSVLIKAKSVNKAGENEQIDPCGALGTINLSWGQSGFLEIA